ETVWNNNPNTSATGGGRSVVFAKLPYQSMVPGNFRTVPDVSGNADPNTGVLFLINKTLMRFGGTSIVSPFMAAYLMTIYCNTFANPLFYVAPLTCYHDIVTGSNGAYSATKGYDLCSGWGSIN